MSLPAFVRLLRPHDAHIDRFALGTTRLDVQPDIEASLFSSAASF
jgi:hypothetical protein